MSATVPQIQFGADRRSLDPLRGFRTPGEFLYAVHRAGAGGRVDERLEPLRQAVAGSDENSGADGGSGGFLVPAGLAPTALRRELDDDPCAGRTLRVPMSAPIVGVPARVDANHQTSVSGGLTVTRGRLQTTAIASSREKFEGVVLEAKSTFALTFATDELVTDSIVTFAEVLAIAFRDEMAALDLDERLRGLDARQYRGILHSPALITVDAEPGQAAGTITGPNIEAMRGRCWGYRRAVWIATPDTQPQVMRLSLPVGVGGSELPLFHFAESEDEMDMLAGRPIFFNERASNLGAVGDLVLVDWTQYLDGTYQAQTGVDSIHVRFVEHEHAFKFWARTDGAPWWQAPLTPKYSTTTRSPYVTLAARA